MKFLNFEKRTNENKKDELNETQPEEFDAEIEEKVSIAKDVITPEEVLAKLSKDPSEKVRVAVADNWMTAREILGELGKDDSEKVKKTAANNPNAPIELQATTFENPSEYIKSQAYRNPKTPPKKLAKLSYHINNNIREGVAGNSSTSIEVLERLLTYDVDEYVRAMAKKQLEQRRNDKDTGD